MQRVDYLIVGAGLTGGTIARALQDAGREVLALDRRPHVGGNVHDHVHEPSGIRIHSYGPHYFRTGSDRLWDFVNRFADFFPYEACLRTIGPGGELLQWPPAAADIDRIAGVGWSPTFDGQPANFEQAALSLMPREVYELFVKEYNEKQWGVPATQLAAELCKRFDVRHDNDPRLKRSKHQGIPVEGYAAFTRRLFEGIPVQTGVDYLKRRGDYAANELLIFTGPIDAYFGHDLGPLAYRGQRRDHVYREDAAFAQPCGQVNAPRHEHGSHIRTLEWKHMMPPAEQPACPGTVITTETPHTPRDPDGFEYPFPDAANRQRYEAYRKRADAEEGALICGRLGEYRYFDMDQAIARAMVLAERLLGGDAGRSG